MLLSVLCTLACASSRMSASSVPAGKAVEVKRLAIAPGSGVLGDAIAVELFNRGLNIVDARESTSIMGRSGLQEFEFATDAGFSALRASGIDAVLIVKSATAIDETPESASVRITSVESGVILAGLTWQNGWGGMRGSVADRTMRKNLSAAAQEISDGILARIRVK